MIGKHESATTKVIPTSPPIQTLTKDVLGLITSRLNKEEKNALSLTCRFFNNMMTTEKQIILYNIKNVHAENRFIKKRSAAQNGLFLDKDNMVIVSHKSLRALDIHTGKISWKYEGSFFPGRLWISDKKIVSIAKNDIFKSVTVDKTSIIILDALTGKSTVVISHPRLNAEHVSVVEEQIIAKLSNGKIMCWDLNGKMTHSYTGFGTFEVGSGEDLSTIFLTTKKYIIDIFDKQIMVINRHDNSVKTWTIIDTITSATTSNEWLICLLQLHTKGAESTKTHGNWIILSAEIANLDEHIFSELQRCIYEGYAGYYHLHCSFNKSDLVKGNIHNLTSRPVRNGDQPSVFYSLDKGSVLYEDFYYEKTSDGKICRISGLGEIINKPDLGRPFLYLHEHYLFINYISIDKKHSHLFVYDTENKFLINKEPLKTRKINKILWKNGMLLLLSNNEITTYDFKAPHKVELVEEDTKKSCLVM